MKKISVLIKRPGYLPRHVNMSNRLENFQRYVGGYIEVFPLTTDVVVICNEEGKLLGLPYNCTLLNETFVGDIIVCGVDGDEFTDLPISYKDMKLVLPQLWETK